MPHLVPTPDARSRPLSKSSVRSLRLALLHPSVLTPFAAVRRSSPSLSLNFPTSPRVHPAALVEVQRPFARRSLYRSVLPSQSVHRSTSSPCAPPVLCSLKSLLFATAPPGG